VPTIRTVAVLGLGLMGRGIAQVVAQAGVRVIAVETDQTRVDTGLAAVAEFLEEGVRRGKVTAEQRAQTMERITGTSRLADVAAADLVIEAVVENRDTKRELLAAVAAAVGPTAVIASNTSALSVTDLAAAVPAPERVAGLHFFNPAPLMPVVEVVAALQTARPVVETLAGFVSELGKTPVEVKDRPGFLVNRLLMPYLNDVVAEFDADLASAEDIDLALKLGLGYRMGPLELLDLIGLDTHHHATTSAYEATLDPQFAPPPLLTQMVAAGFHGRKTGRGFRLGGTDTTEATR
jgi:3-hydroxybutyryl-CoA dehydrogenase